MFQSLIDAASITDWSVLGMIWFMLVFSAVIVYVLVKGKTLESDTRHLPLEDLESESAQGGSL